MKSFKEYIERKRIRRLYKKARKPFKKQYKRIAKETAPWDYCFILQYITECLKDMEKYYEDGYNVWAMEDDEWPERKEVCREALKLFNNWEEGNFGTDMELDDKNFFDFWNYLGKYLRYLWD